MSDAIGQPEGQSGSHPDPPHTVIQFGMDHDPILELYFKELETQTDRGFAVLAAAFLPWRTRKPLRRDSKFPILRQAAFSVGWALAKLAAWRTD